jgi:ligand-binding sensor domain-containing protein/two-component sensor histidine kinase
LQDKDGFIWFLTGNGLNRYDGYTFKIYDYNPSDSHSITIGYYYSLCEDTKGVLWMNSENLGIYSFDPATETFHNYRHSITDPNSLANDLTEDLVIDKSGRVWIATQSGLDMLDPANGRIAHYTHRLDDPGSISANFITSLSIDEDDNVWLTSSSPGIDYFNTKTGRLIRHFDFGSSPNPLEDWQNHPYGAYPGRNGIVWIGSRDSGLYSYNTRTGEIKNHLANNDGSLSDNGIYEVYEDHAGNIWMGTDAGSGTVAYMQRSTGQCIHHSIPDIQHLNFLEDRSHKVWICTMNGIYSFNPKHKIFHTFAHEDSHTNSLTNNFVSTFLRQPSGHLLVATRGVDIFLPSTGEFTHLDLSVKGKNSEMENLVWSIYEDKSHILWFAASWGLVSYNPVTQTHRWYRHDENDSLSLCATACTGILEDSKGRYWVTTWGGGFASFDPVKGQFHAFKVHEGENSISTKSTAGLFQDSRGIIYIGSVNGGLITFNPDTRQFKIYRHRAGDSESVSNNSTHQFIETGEGIIWFGTLGGGMNAFNPQTGKFRSFTTRDGLCSNVVVSILPDKKGKFWLGTYNGLSCFEPPADPFLDPKPVRFRNFTKSDGLPDNRMSFGAAFADNDGTFYFGTENSGFFSFRPEELHDNNFVSPVYITDFSLFNRSVKPQGPEKLLTRPIEHTGEIRLNYDQDKISFTFASLNYIHPEKNRYAYKLEGFDKEWIYTDGVHRTANYTNLDAREYIFRVKGSNNDGIWNPAETTLRLIISPPFWETWWFRLAVVTALILLSYALYRFRLDQVVRLQLLRNKIAHDLHDDIGSTLNSISIFSEVAQQEPSRQKEALEMIGESSRKVIEAMSDIVWTINPHNDSFEKIIERMRSFSFNVLRARNIEHSFKAGEDLNGLKLSLEDRRNLFLIFKETINNLVKYADATRVKIDLLRDGNLVSLIVRDNGKGFDPSIEYNGNGINSMKKRAGEMRAALVITSAFNEGSSIELKFRSS